MTESAQSLHEQATEVVARLLHGCNFPEDRTKPDWLSLTEDQRQKYREKASIVADGHLGFYAAHGWKLMPRDLPDLLPSNVHPSFKTIYHQAHDVAAMGESEPLKREVLDVGQLTDDDLDKIRASEAPAEAAKFDDEDGKRQ